MTYLFKLAQRIAKIRPQTVVALLVAAGCSKGEKTEFLAPNPNQNTQVLGSISVEPQVSSVRVGSELRFTATGRTAAGVTIPVTVDWSATGGIVTPDGRYTGVLTGNFVVRATARERAVSDSALVSVWDNTTDLVALVVSPDSSVIEVGDSLDFSAALEMASGSMTGGASVVWSSTGGQISPTGRFTSSMPGLFEVSAVSVNNLRGTARILVQEHQRRLTGVRLSPTSVEVAQGGSVQFAATADYDDGSSGAADVEWGSTGGTVVNGLYSVIAGPGQYLVVATDVTGQLADTAVVTVPAPTLSRLIISPEAPVLSPGALQQFSAQAQMSDGSFHVVPLVWQAAQGSIDADGVYTAGSTEGSSLVIVTAPGSQVADTAVVLVEVAPVSELARVNVNPSSAIVPSGGTRQFTVSGVWTWGGSSTPTVTWSVTGGTITPSGLFSAGSIPGTYSVTARAANGRSDTSAIEVIDPVLTALHLSPSTSSRQPGQSQQFTVSGTWSNGSTSAPAVDYTATGGSITAGGLYVAGSSAGTFRVIATAVGGTLADTSLVTISTPAPTLTAVVLTPTAVVLAPGGVQQFSAVGLYSNGNTGSISISWSETGGSINSSGRYTAGSTPGTYRVIARQSGNTRADTSVVTITSPAAVTSVTVSPKPATSQVGATTQFAVSAAWSDGSTTIPPIVWTSTGGSITSGGLYTAGAIPGTFRVVATHQGGTKSDTSVVTLTAVPPSAPTLTGLVVSPKPTSVQVATTRQFNVSATWSDGGTSVPAIAWSATGGTITAGGLYTAGSTAGTFRAIASGGGKADTSVVTVTSVSAPTLTSLTVAPKPTSLAAGATQQFSVAAVWSNGTSTLPAITWTATGGTISGSGLYTAGASAGTFRAIASGGGKADTATVTVTAPPAPPASGCAAYPGSIWCDDFEQNRLSSYFEYDNDGGDFVRMSGVGIGGSTGMRARWQPGETDAGNLKITFGLTPSNSSFSPVDGGTTKYRDVYWRMYLRHQSGWVGGGADKLTRATSFASNNWAQAMFGHVWSGGAGNNALALDPASGTDAAGALLTTGYNDFAHMRWLGLASGPTPIFDAAHVGQWFCIESHAQLNTAGQSNGVFEFWVNDALELRQTNLNWLGSYSAYGINAVFFENFWNAGSPVTQERYFDDIVVSTQRIGCGAAVPPTPPTATLTSLVLNPSSVSVAAGTTRQFTASASWSDGSTTLPSLGWSATGGTVSSSGLYTAGSTAGTYRVIASGGGRADTSSVTVTVSTPVVTAFALTPSGISLPVGGSQQFTPTATWSDGVSRPVTVSYSASGGAVSSSGLYTAGSVTGTFAVIASCACGFADTASVAVTPVQTGEPQPTGSIVYDNRAGGAQSIQGGLVSTLSGILNKWNDSRYSSGATGFFETNVDGQGTHAHGIQWAGNGQEQEAMLATPVSAPASGWYTSWKMYFGKSPSGGGSGGVGQFELTGANAHQKIMLWYRQSDAGEAHRIYLVMRPGDTKFEVDGTSWSSNFLSINPYNLRGQVIKMTVWIQPTTGSIKVWVNGTLALNQSGQTSGLGTMGLALMQQTVTTRIPLQTQTQYTWDTVVWY